MLLSLNEHCLNHLCKYLSLEDQFVLSQVCAFFKDFFENNYWTWQCKKINLTDELWDRKEYAKHLPAFLQSAETSLEHIDLDSEHVAKYKSLLIELKFPKIRSVAMSLGKLYTANLFFISQIFPKIKKLHITGNVDGRHISLFKELEELNLKPHLWMFTEEKFIEIFHLPNLKKLTLIDEDANSESFLEVISLAHHCSTLEEIVLNEDVYFKGIMNSLKNIKSLRKMTVETMGYYISRIINKIEKHFGEAIATLVLYRMSIDQTTFPKIQRLRRLVFHTVIIDTDAIEELFRNLPKNLEEFVCKIILYRKHKIEASAFIPLISNCPNLQLLDVSGNNISENFVADIGEAISSQDRKQPLLLRCFQTNLSKQSLQSLVLPGNLQVTFLKGSSSIDKLDHPCFQVELNRANIKDEYVEEEVDEYEYDPHILVKLLYSGQQ